MDEKKKNRCLESLGFFLLTVLTTSAPGWPYSPIYPLAPSPGPGGRWVNSRSGPTSVPNSTLVRGTGSQREGGQAREQAHDTLWLLISSTQGLTISLMACPSGQNAPANSGVAGGDFPDSKEASRAGKAVACSSLSSVKPRKNGVGNKAGSRRNPRRKQSGASRLCPTPHAPHPALPARRA